MQFYVKALLWAAIGMLLGFAIWFVFLQPASPITPQMMQNTPPPNDTLPPLLETGLVNITMIEAPNCDECNAEGLLLEQTKTVLLSSEFLRTGVSKSIRWDSPEAKALIAKYNITELPSVIVEGDVGRDQVFVSAWKENVGTLEGTGALVTRLGYPPYYNITTMKVVGLVKAIGIKATGCLECGDPGLFISSLEGPTIGMVFTEKDIYEENSSEGMALIASYNITKVPTIFLSEEGASAYPVYSQIKVLGTVEGGWFVLRDVVPPYLDLADNRTLRGLVKAKYLVNSSCAECFDITLLSDYISQSTGLVISESQTYEADSADGRALIAKYNITKIPTLVFSPDAKYYPYFSQVWENQTSTIEADGWFVFRAHELLSEMGYQNISASG
ncbi:MAG: hypothetical protein V1861_04550 [Candidatus Micrarchaeota archaeon]